MPWILLDAYAAAFGLITGSFLNVLIYRLPRGISTVLPRSRCPSCGHPIRAWDNVPLVSYLLLGGRCRHCRARIPWRYPLVEASTAALFVGCLEFFGATSDAVVAAVLGCLLIALAWIDAEHFILPDLLTLPGLMAGLVVGPLTGWISWRGALVGAAVGGGMLWLLREAWIILRKEEGMGLGDVKMLAMVGAFLGWKGVVVTLFLSSLAGATVGLGLMALGRVGMKSELPFGVFLGAGALAALFTGPYLVARYLSLL